MPAGGLFDFVMTPLNDIEIDLMASDLYDGHLGSLWLKVDERLGMDSRLTLHANVEGHGQLEVRNVVTQEDGALLFEVFRDESINVNTRENTVKLTDVFVTGRGAAVPGMQYYLMVAGSIPAGNDTNWSGAERDTGGFFTGAMSRFPLFNFADGRNNNVTADVDQVEEADVLDELETDEPDYIQAQPLVEQPMVEQITVSVLPQINEVQPIVDSREPVALNSTTAWNIDGTEFQDVVRLLPSSDDSEVYTPYVVARVVADVLGLNWDWRENSDGTVTSIFMTADENTVVELNA
jgi:hypothetical protein